MIDRLFLCVLSLNNKIIHISTVSDRNTAAILS